MTKKLFALIVPISLLANSCAKQPAPPAPQAAIVDHHPVLYRLVSRHETLTVSKGPTGPVYSVHTLKGQPLLVFATRDQLRRAHPDISIMLDSAIVLNSNSIDASLLQRPVSMDPLPAKFTAPILNADGPLMLHGE